MNKANLAIGLLVAVILVGGVVMARSSNIAFTVSTLATPAATTGNGVTSPAVVTFTGNAFFPAVVKITRGGSIQFVNNSDRALRIAPVKDPRDGTSAYLGFQTAKSLGRGETFGVSLTQPGIWGYKNLQDSNVVGVVIVE